MEDRKPYVRPVIEELGELHEMIGGGIFDIGDILNQLLGGGRKPGPPGGSH